MTLPGTLATAAVNANGNNQYLLYFGRGRVRRTPSTLGYVMTHGDAHEQDIRMSPRESPVSRIGAIPARGRDPSRSHRSNLTFAGRLVGLLSGDCGRVGDHHRHFGSISPIARSSTVEKRRAIVGDRGMVATRSPSKGGLARWRGFCYAAIPTISPAAPPGAVKAFVLAVG